MKKLFASTALGGALIVAAHAQGRPGAADGGVPGTGRDHALDWSAWTRPLGPPPTGESRARTVAAAQDPVDAEAAIDIDVVDAHWMALTMWGEGRGEGDAGMRAVGHVIRNRWDAKSHGAFVTDTVSAAFQFSCWNEDDPNRAAMLDIDRLREGSADHRNWLAARRIEDEILSGRSADPTHGALFYHSIEVQHSW